MRVKPVSAKRRKEAAVIKRVRSLCVARDGHCRIGAMALYLRTHAPTACFGKSTWAHLGEWRRSKTRGKPPEERHHTKGSMMLCEEHHRAYDAHEFDLAYHVEAGANGIMATVPYVKHGAVA